MVSSSSSDDISGLGTQGVGAFRGGAGSGWGGVGGRPSLSPSLDLQFATDKTLTARKGPTPVFTRASTATFVGSNGLIQSAAINTARFDHDPITLACKGLLIEESRTNLCTQSANLTAWSGGFTISGSTTAPDGTSGSYLAAIGTTNCQTLLTANVTGLHTMSVFLKRNTTDWVRIQGVQGANLHSVNLWVNLATGAIGTLAIAAGTPTSLSAQVTPAGNGWYRCSVTASYPATSYLNLNVISATADASTTRVAGSIYGVWGAQIEAGAFPTSYIPTTTASVVRSADICSITGAAFTNLWNTAGGTFLFDGVLPSAPTLNNRLLLSSGGVRRWLYGNNAGQGGSTESLTAFDGVTTPSYFTNVRLTTRFKIAISVEALSCRASFNGSSVTSISHNGALLNSVTLLALCEGGAGTITGVKYYRKNLSNQKLQAITA